MATSISAVTAALNTYELLEHILSFASTVSLVHGRRVSKRWKAVIDRSDELQQLLFLSPVPIIAGLGWREKQGERILIIEDITGEVVMGPYLVVTLHPAIKACDRRRGGMSLDLDFDLQRLSSFTLTRWKHMFISQPPIQKIKIRRRTGDVWTGDEHTKVVVDERGVTIAHILDEIDATLDGIKARMKHVGHEQDPETILRGVWGFQGCRARRIIVRDIVPDTSPLVALASGNCSLVTSEDAMWLESKAESFIKQHNERVRWIQQYPRYLRLTVEEFLIGGERLTLRM